MESEEVPEIEELIDLPDDDVTPQDRIQLAIQQHAAGNEAVVKDLLDADEGHHQWRISCRKPFEAARWPAERDVEFGRQVLADVKSARNEKALSDEMTLRAGIEQYLDVLLLWRRHTTEPAKERYGVERREYIQLHPDGEAVLDRINAVLARNDDLVRELYNHPLAHWLFDPADKDPPYQAEGDDNG